VRACGEPSRCNRSGFVQHRLPRHAKHQPRGGGIELEPVDADVVELDGAELTNREPQART